MANSSMLVLPRMIAPACLSLVVIVASYGGCQPSRMRLPQVVGRPLVANTSLTATGTPASGLRGSLLWRLASTAAACSSALSAATCKKACTRSSTAAIRSRWARVTSVAETSLRSSAAASSAAVMRVSSIVSVLPQDPRDLEPLLLDGGRLVEGFGRGQARARLVVAVYVGQAGRVRRRRDALGGDLLDLRDGRDDLIQLGRQMVEFGVAERDPGQPRQVRDLVTGNGHARDSRGGSGAGCKQ